MLHILGAMFDYFAIPVQVGIVNMLGAMSMLIALRQDSKARVIKI